MRDKSWVILKPANPDRDVIAKHFFKTGKKGIQTFKTGKTIINFHVPNEIYNAMVEKREADELSEEVVPAKDPKVEPSMVVEFTVGASAHLQFYY
jgi:hypothetical protein